MADTTDVLGLRIPSADGSDPADLATIIGNLGADVDATVGNPSMTTTQINALAGDAKAAGRRVWDSTLGVEKVSNGTSWEPQASRAYVDDSIDAAMDEHAATVVPGRVLTDSGGRAEVALPTPPSGKRWSVTTGVENKQRSDTPTIVKQTMGTSSVVFQAEQWTGSWNGMPAEIHYCARLVPANPGAWGN